MNGVSALSSRGGKFVVGAVIAAVFLALPFVLSTFFLGLVIEMLIFALFATSFNLLYGYTGMLSFGHAAFYGLGAYGVAFALTGQLPYFPQVEGLVPAMLLAVGLVAVVGAIAGAICVVRRGIYFAMLTLAVNMLLYTIATEQDWLTGGRQGLLVGSPTVELGVLSFSPANTAMYFYFVFAIVAGGMILMLRITNSPFGKLLIAIRENDQRSEFIGVPVRRYSWASFVLSSVFAGAAGALISVRMFLVNPSTMHWSASAEPVFATLVGGPTTFLGPAFGAFVMIFLEEQLTDFTTFWQFWLGVLLIPIVLFFPDGILGTARNKLEKRGD